MFNEESEKPARIKEKETEKRRYDKPASHRKAVKSSLEEDEAEQEIQQVIRVGSGSEFLQTIDTAESEQEQTSQQWEDYSSHLTYFDYYPGDPIDD